MLTCISSKRIHTHTQTGRTSFKLEFSYNPCKHIAYTSVHRYVRPHELWINWSSKLLCTHFASNFTYKYIKFVYRIHIHSVSSGGLSWAKFCESFIRFNDNLTYTRLLRMNRIHARVDRQTLVLMNMMTILMKMMFLRFDADALRLGELANFQPTQV